MPSPRFPQITKTIDTLFRLRRMRWRQRWWGVGGEP
jgi:hypothetical protein